MNDSRLDRLYELLPAIYRIRDAEQGESLRALFQVISEQVNVVEDDIAQLYANWFIETCEDWVVPYLGDLIGYTPVREAGEPSSGLTPQQRLRNSILIPRREVANTIRYRRRKGSLALLELLANDVAGWPGRAVEFYRLLAWTQHINHLHPDRGLSVDIRSQSTLDLLDSPFDSAAHSVDVRSIQSRHSRGYHNIPSVGLFVWRLKSYSVTKTPACCVESVAPHCFTFSVLGNDSPLYIHPEQESDPTDIAGEFNLPVAIRRSLLNAQKDALYGEGKSLQIWQGVRGKENKKLQDEQDEAVAVSSEQIVIADLSDWNYHPKKGMVAVDPVLGRMAFPLRHPPKNGVWVSYHYGFSAEIGGGEYERSLVQQEAYALYRVGKNGEFDSIAAAIERWETDVDLPNAMRHAVIEIVDNGVYVEQINITFKKERQSLQIRAANRKRPVIRLLDWQTNKSDSLTVIGYQNNGFTLDGLLVTGRSVQLSGDLTYATLRHTTLVPGWSVESDCEPHRPAEPSLEVLSPAICVKIEHSIIGSIQINPVSMETEPEAETDEDLSTHAVSPDGDCGNPDENQTTHLEPIRLCISDSIIDGTGRELEAIGAPDCTVAYAQLTILRTTVFGLVQVHAIELGENCIFDGQVTVARRQQGCLRFCYVPPESRTPRRYQCQPDLVKARIEENMKNDKVIDSEQINRAKQQEAERVRPLFNSVRYGMPAYCQLADCCTEEIKTGADDESEMGVFHDLFQPQRLANLRVRLDEYLPARMDVDVILSN